MSFTHFYTKKVYLFQCKYIEKTSKNSTFRREKEVLISNG